MPEKQGRLNIHIERTIRVTITLPTTHLYKFLEEFGEAFAIDTVSHAGVMPTIRPVTEYGTDTGRSDGRLSFAHFTILEVEEGKWNDFIKEFTERHSIAMPPLVMEG